MFRVRVFNYLLNKNLRRTVLQKSNLPWVSSYQFQPMFTAKFAGEPNENLTSNSKRAPRNVSPPVSNETEQEFVARLKNDPDVFGGPPETETYDEGDLREKKHFEDRPSPEQKLRTKQYADMIKDLVKKRKIKEAIDVLETRMIKEDRVKPENYIYNLLLGACGRVGYTKKAFALYNEMKQRALKVTGGTYTALFNACANSPWPEDGLTRAKHLRNIMIEKMYEPNDTNYNAMIKAFGRCGDLATSFGLVDEMVSKGFRLKDDTVNFLLQACISDKEAGFRHALLVWRKLVKMRIKPSLHTYNLMLRNIRDCGIGDIEVVQDVLGRIVENHELKRIENEIKLLSEPPISSQESHEPKQIDNGSEPATSDTKVCDEIENNSSRHNPVEPRQIDDGSEPAISLHDLKVCEKVENNQLQTEDRYTPNLMAKVPHLGDVISLSEIKKAEDRLLLVGGMKGFLRNMEEHRCAPDIKTFTQLLDCLPGSVAAERELMNAMKKLHVRPDVDFFNMLIKKRSIRFDYEGAKDVLGELRKMKYSPDLITYGVLALGCKTKTEALELIEEMQEQGYRLNAEILGAMLHQACFHMNFSYVLEIMELSLREEVEPNSKFMECLAEFKKKCKHISNDKDNKLSHTKNFQKGFKIFLMRYKTWLQKVEVDPSEKEHPWKQFRQPTETDVRHYKEKSVKFRPRHASLFKVKTSTKRR